MNETDLNEMEDSLDVFMNSIKNEIIEEDANISKNSRKRDETDVFWDEEDALIDSEEFRRKKRKNVAEQMNFENKNKYYEENSEDESTSSSKSRHAPILLPNLQITEYFVKSFDKNHYNEDPFIQNMNLNEISELKDMLHINSNGMNVPKPIPSFAYLSKSMPPSIQHVLTKRAYGNPTAIQCQCIPVGLSGRDVLGIASTGSGKTLAYLIPVVVHAQSMIEQWGVDSNFREGGEGVKISTNAASPYCLILAPTRELSIQINKEVREFTKKTNIRSTLLAGGMNKTEQFRDLKSGVHIVTANTGRLVDLVHMKALKLDKLTMVVLDEADRMLSEGYDIQVRNIIECIRPDRQILLFSATMSETVEVLARELLRSPVKITIGEAGNAAATILQETIVLSEENKWCWMQQNIFNLLDVGKLIIFCNSKSRVVDLSHLLEELLSSRQSNDSIDEQTNLKTNQIHQTNSVLCLHGDMQQTDRLKVLDKFSKKKCSVLVASDVASRGLDIPSLEYVINYDMANDIDVHINRIGRCGRKGERGVAYTLITDREEKMAAILVEHLEASDASVPPELLRIAMKFAPFKSSRLSGSEMNLKRKKIEKKQKSTGATGIGYRDVRTPKTSPHSLSFQRSSNTTFSLLSGTSKPEVSQMSSPSMVTAVKGGKRWDSKIDGSNALPQQMAANDKQKHSMPSTGKIIDATDELSSSDEDSPPPSHPPSTAPPSSMINIVKRKQQRQRLSSYGSTITPYISSSSINTNTVVPSSNKDHSTVKRTSRWDVKGE